MPEIKNTFLQSKMNKDLDARLIPNGQYRDAQNINVNKSEGADVGAVENVLGNIEITSFGATSNKCEIIGYYNETTSDTIFVFITNYTDSSFNRLSNFAPSNAECFIAAYNLATNQNTILVKGNFLNFSKTQPVLGISVLEDLLFWTDNRNQPRKINIQKALSFPESYYTTEDQISVAKYYPWKPIRFWKDNSGTIESTMKDVVSENLPSTLTVTTQTATTNNTIINVNTNYDWQNGAKFIGAIASGTGITGEPTLVGQGGVGQLVLSSNQTIGSGVTITFGKNPYYDANFPGDEKFLTDKFIKLAYRFRYDDNEYSLISPFSQSIFIPKQDGYLIDSQDQSAERSIVESSVVKWFENKVNQATLQIDAPEGITDWKDVIDTLHVNSLEIIYKDSNEGALKILDTIDIDIIVTLTGSTYEYVYNSKKPITVLPEKEISRVSDKVPVRALTQETVGNRILYGNYIAQTASLPSLDYNVSVDNKLAEGTTGLASLPYLRKEYQNHTVKQNRTYQVGVVLVDKFGRMSDVILSTNDVGITDPNFGFFGGSTVYSNYRSSGQDLLSYSGSTPNDVWPGDSLKMLFNNVIPSTSSTIGYQGLYSATNPLGWYTYKVVVKQQEQDYYNVYLPGIINGYPRGSSGDLTIDQDVAHVVLINDNINKVPRDLREVGSQDELFASSVQMFGRVTNIATTPANTSGVNRTSQYYPVSLPDISTLVGTVGNIGIDRTETGIEFNGSTSGYNLSPFYNVQGGSTSTSATLNLNSSPFIARIATEKSIGVIAGHDTTAQMDFLRPPLAVYETSPTFSQLDIYFETSTSGLISELNTDILTNDAVTPQSLQPINFVLFENDGPNTFCTGDFYPIDGGGVILNNANTSIELFQALDGNNTNVTSKFNTTLTKNANNSFKMQTANNAYFVYTSQSPSVDNYEFTFKVFNGAVFNYITVNRPNVLSNVKPSWTNNSGNTPYALGNKQPQVVSSPNSYCALVQLDGRNGTAATTDYQYKAGLIWKVKPNTLQFEWVANGIWANYADQNAIQIVNALGQASSLIPETIVHDTRSLNVNDNSNPYLDYFNTQNTNFRVTLQLVDASDNGGIEEELQLTWTITTPNTVANACNVIT